MNLNSNIKHYAAIIWPVVIGYLCLMPSADIPKVNIVIPHFDKVVHFGLFFILGYVWSKPSGFWKFRLSLWLIVVGFIYGGLIEVVQYSLIEGRSGDWVDWMADNIGLLSGSFVYSYFPFGNKKA